MTAYFIQQALYNLASIPLDEIGAWFQGNVMQMDTMGSGGAAAGLAALWFFKRVVRTAVSVVMGACIIYLIVRLSTGYNLLELLQQGQ